MTSADKRAMAFEVFRSRREAFVSWARQRQAVHHLGRMPDRLLDDIGIERAQIRIVTRRGRQP